MNGQDRPRWGAPDTGATHKGMLPDWQPTKEKREPALSPLRCIFLHLKIYMSSCSCATASRCDCSMRSGSLVAYAAGSLSSWVLSTAFQEGLWSGPPSDLCSLIPPPQPDLPAFDPASLFLGILIGLLLGPLLDLILLIRLAWSRWIRQHLGAAAHRPLIRILE